MVVYGYSAYGLGIHSALPLPELVPLAEATPDVTIRLGRVANRGLPSNRREAFYFEGDTAYLRWPEVGVFQVARGREIIVDPASGADEALVRLPLLGAVLAVLMHQRGLFLLHAGAVSIGGAAIGLMAAKGGGKSTTVATLHSRGNDLIADDMVAISFVDSKPVVWPGVPQLKLWPDAVRSSLGHDPDTLPRLAAETDKRSHRVSSGFAEGAVHLRCLFVLAGGPRPSVRQLRPQEAIVYLLAHSYVSRFGGALLSGAGAASHLSRCADVARRVPVYKLERPRSLESLHAIADLLEGCLAEQPVSNRAACP